MAANRYYNTALHRLLTGDLNLTSDTIKAMLIITGGTFDRDQDFVSDLTPASYEAAGGSYARQTLGTKTFSVDDVNNRGEFSCATITFTAVPAQGGSNIIAVVIYEHVGADAANPLIAWIDDGTGFPLAPNGSDIQVTINAEGLLQLTNPA